MTPYAILKAAINSAKTKETKDRLEQISWAEDYAEPGYCLDRPAKKAGIYLANWNEPDIYDRDLQKRVKVEDADILPRLAKALEKAGANIEWEDEWAACHDCSKIVRTEPDNYFWKPSFTVDLAEGAYLCMDCHKDQESQE